MSQPSPTPEPLEPRRRKGHALIAWVVIVLLAAGIIVLQSFRPARERSGTLPSSGIFAFQMIGRYLVGTASLTRMRDPQLLASARQFYTGPPEQRWCYVVLTGELAGPKQALEQLAELDQRLKRHEIELNPRQQAVRAALYRVYHDYDGGEWGARSLSPADRDLLRTQLGWFGELALAPAQGPDGAARDAVLSPAYRTLFAFFALAVLIAGLGFVGFLGLLVLVVLWWLGLVRGRLGGPTPGAGIYAETFALWMVLYIALNIGVQLLRLPRGSLLLTGLVDLLSLLVLVWPVVRGIPWRQVRQDVGLTAGSQPALEPAVGVFCYSLAIPLLAVGLAIVLGLVELQKASPAGPPEENFSSGTDVPAHPFAEYVAASGWWDKAVLLLLASVIAPIVEETMFRGVLHRHLRDATHRLGGTGSALLSATVIGFLFAAIHPQGLTAVPALMAIAYALTLAREWRGTLVPGMVTHGLNNGLVMTFALLAGG
jgi:membrane protease YdiL (CAAX protease family)